MPRKKFEDAPYDPIAADLAREVAATGRSVKTAIPSIVSLPSPRQNLKKEAGSEVSRTLPRNHEPHISKRVVFTRKEDDDLSSFILRLQAQAGTKVTFSLVVRTALGVVMQAEEEILREIGERFSQDYPSTHDSIAVAEYEDRWRRCLLKALRRLPHPNLANTSGSF